MKFIEHNDGIEGWRTVEVSPGHEVAIVRDTCTNPPTWSGSTEVYILASTEDIFNGIDDFNGLNSEHKDLVEVIKRHTYDTDDIVKALEALGIEASTHIVRGENGDSVDVLVIGWWNSADDVVDELEAWFQGNNFVITCPCDDYETNVTVKDLNELEDAVKEHCEIVS